MGQAHLTLLALHWVLAPDLGRRVLPSTSEDQQGTCTPAGPLCYLFGQLAYATVFVWLRRLTLSEQGRT